MMPDPFERGLIAALPALQTTVERALKARDRHDPSTRLDPWLFRILRNAWIDAARRTVTRGEEIDIFDTPGAAKVDGAHAVETALTLRETEAALATLPVEQRAVIHLVCYEDLTYAEAADVLGLPVGTVMSRLARGRLALARKLGID